MRNSLPLLVVALLGAALSAAPSQAAESGPTGSYVGMLHDAETGLPMVGVELALVGPGEHRTKTGPGGRFVFRNIPAGTYLYLFGFEPQRDKDALRVSSLLKKNIEVAQLAAPLDNIRFETLLERPKKIVPRVAKLRFPGGRRPAFYKPILLREPLNLHWKEQYLSLAVRFQPRRCREPSLRVMDGSTGLEVDFQLSDIQRGRGDFIRSCTVTFLASLAPFEQKVYPLCSDWRPGFQPPQYETDLKVTVPDEKTGEQVLSNSMIAVRLPPAKGDKPSGAGKCPAPILAVRGVDGVWFGKGSFVSDRKIESFKCEETEKGPLFKEFKITYTFAKKEEKDKEETAPASDEEKTPPDEYQVTVRLYAKRDYLIIREEMGGNVDLSFRFSAAANFSPDTALFVRDGAAVFEPLPDASPEGSTTLAVVRAWNATGVRKSHNWYGLVSSGNRKDAVGLVQINGSRWWSEDYADYHTGAWVANATDDTEVRLLTDKKAGLRFEFPYRKGTRELALVVFDKTKNWDAASMAAKEPDRDKTHYLNRLHVRFSQMNLLQMMNLRAGGAVRVEQPSLLFNSRTYPALKKSFDKDPEQFPELLHDVFGGSRVRASILRSHIWNGVMTLRHAFTGVDNEKRISGFCGRLAHPEIIEPIVKYTTLLYDANARSGLFSEREKEFIFNTFTMVAAQLTHPNYLPVFSNDPEAAARRDCALTLISLFLNRHPMSRTRRLNASRRMQNELGKGARTGGISFDTGATLRAMNLWADLAPTLETAAGIDESPFSWPLFVGTLERLTAVTTPPDRRFGGARLLPTIGRCRQGDREILAVMGRAASQFTRNAPALAERLAWAWEQAGRPTFGQRTRHKALLKVFELLPSDVKSKKPEKMESQVLPGFGSLMRAEFGTPDEAYLLLKCSRQPPSFHHDQLGLIFYAWGAPLLVDAAGPPERQAAWAHNTVRLDSRLHRAGAQTAEFFSQDVDDYVSTEMKVEALSELKEYTPAELARAAADAAKKKKPFHLPPGHRADGSQTAELLPAPEKLDRPVTVSRHVFFNRPRQYAVVVDRIKGTLPADVFFNVLAEQAKLEGDTARFVGPFGVDLDIHAFGTGQPQASVEKDIKGRWVLRLSQPAPPKPPEPKKDDKEKATDDKGAAPADAKKDAKQAEPPKTDEVKEREKEPEPPTVEYITVLCPIRRGPADAKNRPYAAPTVEKLKGVTGVRITYGKTTRYIFLSEKDIEYRDENVLFKGKRGSLTIRPTHFDVVLYDAGELRYRGRGLKTDHGIAEFRIMPGAHVDGKVLGPNDKVLVFYGLGRGPRYLSFNVDGKEFNGEGDDKQAEYGVPADRHITATGLHTITIKPR